MKEERRHDYPSILRELQLLRENQDAIIVQINSRLANHDEVLNGNGKVGLKTHVEILDSRYRGIDSTLQKHFENDDVNFKLLFKSLYLGMGALAVITFVMKFLF